jgi:cell division protein FtsB
MASVNDALVAFVARVVKVTQTIAAKDKQIADLQAQNADLTAQLAQVNDLVAQGNAALDPVDPPAPPSA